MNFLAVSRNLFSFGSKKAFRVISGAFNARSKFSQIRVLHVSQHPRGTNNNMADGSVVEEYSKRAKIAVSFLIQFHKAFPYIPVFMKMSSAVIISYRRMKS